ncbi:MAG: 2-isopropylmalate synthase [Eubacterium sp.]|jgi:2-isopropylmalate synthase|nr:2-isopropylmalate synthase [Eubacterium sp.]
MKGFEKYRKMYFMPPEDCFDWVKKDSIAKAPIWCSVDLRDGNQALIEPMNLEEKIKFYQMLVDIGFKHIEVGFPAASETEYQFLRAIIERGMIPDDVTVQVLTQAREHIIKRTFEAIDGAPNVIVHVYNSTSVAQREQVFKKSKEEIKQIAVDGAKLVYDLSKQEKGNISFEYSPESFTGTEMDYALEVCNAVLDIWQPTPERKAIINLPSTVQYSMPHVFASQIEYFNKNLKYRDSVLISLHPHNDRGSGISDAELGLLAGADRIEGTLFGNGERTGNVDIVTLGMNMYSLGVDPCLNFHNMKQIRETYEKLTNMEVSMRQPYAGDLVFTAFSGSHQDAISKGMACHAAEKDAFWTVPYLPIDPKDLGRTYDSDVIRINSQSGKGGVSYVLKQTYGIMLPEKMKEEFGYLVKDVSDKEHSELDAERIYKIFKETYRNITSAFHVSETHFRQHDGIEATITIQTPEKTEIVTANGNGRLDSVSKALKKHFNITYELTEYTEHSLSRGSSSKALAYVGITAHEKLIWGVGMDEDIIKASINALTAAINRAGLHTLDRANANQYK